MPCTSRRARAAAALTVVALALAGCSSDGDSEEATDESPTTTASDTGSADEGSGGEAAGGDLDPRELEDACTIFGEGTVDEVLGEEVEYPAPNQQTYEIGCNWSATSGAYVFYRLETERPGQEAYDGVMQYIDVAEGTEEVDLGDQAVIKVLDDPTGEQATLDAIINGWYVQITVAGTDDPRAQAIELGEVLEGSLVAFTPMEEGSGSESSGGGEGSEDVVPGTLTDLEVTIDAPADMAGTTTLESLGIVSIAGFANCSQPGSAMFVLAFNSPPAEEPPTPVGVFGITVEEGVDAGETAPAVIGVGLGMSDVATTTNYDGTITVNDEGTGGTFEAAGGPSGTWSCEWAE
jgi:hypothetical protein